MTPAAGLAVRLGPASASCDGLQQTDDRGSCHSIAASARDDRRERARAARVVRAATVGLRRGPASAGDDRRERAWAARVIRAALVGLLLWPGRVDAGDALRERTPVLHLGETCLTVVDRTATPVVHLEYSFPVEDTCAGTYPAPMHQFVALCRPPAPGEVLPQWISRDDVAAAAALQIPLFPIAADDVLVESPAWTDCWTRITPDDARRPLTCEVARAGLDWDVSALAPGAYVIAGYTYQAPLHLWSPRWGIFKVVDDGDPDAAPPVAALAQREAFVYADQQIDVAVCVSAIAGSTLRLEYARHGDALAWQLLAELVVTGSTASAPWVPPPEVHGEDVRLRVRVDDPLGRFGVLEAPELLHVLAVPSPTSGDDEPPAEPADMCRSGEPPVTLYCPPQRGGSSEDTGDTGEVDEPSASGCSCTHDTAPPGGFLFGALVLLTRTTRSRRVTVRRRDQPAVPVGRDCSS